MSISERLTGKEYSELTPFANDLEAGVNDVIDEKLKPVLDDITQLKSDVEALRNEISTGLTELKEQIANIPTTPTGTGTTPTTTAAPSTGGTTETTTTAAPLRITTEEIGPAFRFSQLGEEGRANTLVVAEGGVEPYTFSFQPVLNPLDLTIDSGGNVSGYINAINGNYLTRVIVTDNEGTTAFKDYTINVST